MRGTWQQLQDNSPTGSIDYLQWRRELLESLLVIKHDCVMPTHFVAINAAVGSGTEQ